MLDTCAYHEGPQQAEILDTDAEIRVEILLEIRDPKSQAIFFPIISVKYGNLYHVNCNVRPRATMLNCWIEGWSRGWWLRGAVVSLVD